MKDYEYQLFNDLDAMELNPFELKLKKYNIKANGEQCDKIEKFFASLTTATLFYEFVSECLKVGIQENKIDDIVALKTMSIDTSYKGLTLTDTSTYNATISAGSLIPDSTINESTTTTDIKKMARIINCTYEVVKSYKINQISLIYRIIGRKIGNGIYSQAISVLKSAVSATTSGSTSVTYDNLLTLYGSFNNNAKYIANAFIVSPTVFSQILKFDEMANCVKGVNNNCITLPFGVNLISNPTQADDTIIALDKNFALEFITNDIEIENSLTSNRQLNSFTISIPCAFKVIDTNAVKVMTISA